MSRSADATRGVPVRLPKSFRGERWRRGASVLSVLAMVVLGVLGAGCGASDGMAPQRGVRTTATAHHGGLTIALVAAPVHAKAGAPVRFTASAREGHAAGAIGYRLDYGDGMAAESGVTPMFCIAGPAPAAYRTWRFSHRYRSVGRYRALLHVYVNCTSDHATATVPVTIIGR
jgi:hypothetical protein